MRERDQANSNTMQIRTDFEKLLLQSNQVRNLLLKTSKNLFFLSNRIYFNFVINLVPLKIVLMILKVNYLIQKNIVSN